MKQILYKLFEHQYLGRDEARIILQNIAQGKYNDVQVGISNHRFSECAISP